MGDERVPESLSALSVIFRVHRLRNAISLHAFKLGLAVPWKKARMK